MNISQHDIESLLYNSVTSARDVGGDLDIWFQSRDFRFLTFILENYRESQSQLFQDLWVLFEFKERQRYNQYQIFVEFGATDGKTISNTFLLDKKYKWMGILAEPAKIWHKDLMANRYRDNVYIDHRCVVGSNDFGAKIIFEETSQPDLSHISGNTAYRPIDTTKTYEVETITLNDLIKRRFPKERISFLSIDTEGNELEILKTFDFAQYGPNLIAVEHNHRPDREDIYKLMASNGYIRVFERFSKWDDWYVRSNW